MSVFAIITLTMEAIKAGKTLIAFIQETRDTLRRTRELTVQEETDFLEALAVAGEQDHWKTDAELRAEGKLPPTA